MLKSNAQFVVLWMLAVVSSAGCGTRGFVHVEGKVTLDSKPLANAKVMIAPTKANGPGPFVGTTDREGQFTLSDPNKSRTGAAVGEYSVFISTVDSDPREGAAQVKKGKEIIPTEYRNGSIRFSVPPGGSREVSFYMKSR